MSSEVVQVKNLRKVYGSVTAVDGISFTVEQGEIFGLIGPNGAGKTTTIECLEGLRRPDAGDIRVMGLNPVSDSTRLHLLLGIQLQQAALPERIRVMEALELFAALYPQPLTKQKIMELLEQLGLKDYGYTPFIHLSGGQQQRVFIALALVHDPKIVFLDELTTGLDPHARRDIWGLIRTIRDQGKTIILSTHFMEEAERLCNRLAIMQNGRIVALDSPSNLVRQTSQRVIFSATNSPIELLSRIPGVSRVEVNGTQVVVSGTSEDLAAAVMGVLVTASTRFHDLRTEQGTLEDVFLALTGRRSS